MIESSGCYLITFPIRQTQEQLPGKAFQAKTPSGKTVRAIAACFENADG